MSNTILHGIGIVFLVQSLVPAAVGFTPICHSDFGTGQRVIHSFQTHESSLLESIIKIEDMLIEDQSLVCTSQHSALLSTERTTSDLPPVLQQIADERKDFNINLGKAMDTLRKDMPEILRQLPDFSIYREDITIIDPSGVRLTGLDKYKSAFSFFQTFIQFWFNERSGLQFRIVYDFCRSSIRVSWNAVLYPKLSVMGKPIFVDGISTYKLDAGGKIMEHKIENLVINSNSMVPPYSIISSLLQQQGDITQQRQPGIPVGVGGVI